MSTGFGDGKIEVVVMRRNEVRSWGRLYTSVDVILVDVMV